MTYFLKEKSDTVEATKKFLADVFLFGKVKCLGSDNGPEFISNELEAFLLIMVYAMKSLLPIHPHQNGTAKTSWRSLFEMGRCLLIEVKLPK